MVFDPHPVTVLKGADVGPPRLSTFAQRERWLKELGADEVLQLDPRLHIAGAGKKKILELTADDFIEWAHRSHGAVSFVEGPDFQFGAGRTGDVHALERASAAFGGVARIVPAVEVLLAGGQRVPARSGVVRELIAKGKVTDAAAVLGRSYQIDGTVVAGDQRGRTIGFPTTNIRSEQLLPADGVYAGTAVLPDSLRVPAAISVGVKPSFGVHARTLEAHLIGIGGPGKRIAGYEYGWDIRLDIEHWIRPQVKFSGLEELVTEIKRDCARALQLTGKGPARAGATNA